MVWLDGLDIPLVAQLDGGFFEFGPDEITDRSTPVRSRAERLWAHAGLRPVSAPDTANSPLAAYRWEQTDGALQAQLDLEVEGHPGVVEPGHAAVRFSNPTTGRDALVTLRTEMHRFLAGVTGPIRRQVGSRSGRCSRDPAPSSSGRSASRSRAAMSWPSPRGARLGSSLTRPSTRSPSATPRSTRP